MLRAAASVILYEYGPSATFHYATHCNDTFVVVDKRRSRHTRVVFKLYPN